MSAANADKQGMYFDRLEKQDVLKRRRPSPVRTPKRRTETSEDVQFFQDVWPRHGAGANSFSPDGFGRTGKGFFSGIAPGNMEKPRRRKSAVHRENLWTAGRFAGNHTSAGSSTGVSAAMVQAQREDGTPFRESIRSYTPQLARLLKRAAIALLVPALAFLALNWDSLQDISPVKPGTEVLNLEDPVTPLASRIPATGPSGRSIFVEAPADSRVSYDNVTLNLTDTFSWSPYVVTSGDTISGIAARNSVSQESIIALNGITETWNLQTGKTIKIPNMNGIPYTVKKNDTLGGIAKSTGIPLNVLLDANNIADDNIRAGQVLFIPGGKMNSADLRKAIFRTPEKMMIRPVPGRLTSSFGWRQDPVPDGNGRNQLHAAVDLSGNTGDTVKAAMDGTVLHRGSNASLGNFIILQHGQYQTLYGHLSAFSVSVGDKIKQGQEVGKVGNTGRSTGSHLHFAVFDKGEPVDPLDFF